MVSLKIMNLNKKLKIIFLAISLLRQRGLLKPPLRLNRVKLGKKRNKKTRNSLYGVKEFGTSNTSLVAEKYCARNLFRVTA